MDKPYIINGERATQSEYIKHRNDSFLVRLPKGQQAFYADHAKAMEESLTAFVVRAMKETMCRDLAEKEDKSLSQIAVAALSEAFENIIREKLYRRTEPSLENQREDILIIRGVSPFLFRTANKL